MNVEPIDPEIRALIAAWRLHRRAALKLAVQLDGWENLPEFLNQFLTFDDLAEDARFYGPDYTARMTDYLLTLQQSGDC